MNFRLIFSAVFALAMAAHAQDTWTQLSSGTTRNLNSISCQNTSTCYAVGDSGIIRKTTDGGTNWTVQASGTSNMLRGIHCPARDTCYAVGNYVASPGAIIRKTTNGGTTWVTQTSGTTQNLTAIHCSTVNTCVTVGTSGWISITTDGGALWNGSTHGTANQHLYGVQYANANTIFAVGVGGYVLRSTNGGSTWSDRSVDTSATLYGLHFLNADTGWVVGAGGVIRKTVDGTGTAVTPHWTRQNGSAGGEFRTVHFATPTTGYAMGTTAAAFKTSNGGTSWGLLNISVLNNFYWYSLSFPDSTTGYAVGSQGVIAKLVRPTSVILSVPVFTIRNNKSLFRIEPGVMVNIHNQWFNLQGRTNQSIIPTLPYPTSGK